MRISLSLEFGLLCSLGEPRGQTPKHICLLLVIGLQRNLGEPLRGQTPRQIRWQRNLGEPVRGQTPKRARRLSLKTPFLDCCKGAPWAASPGPLLARPRKRKMPWREQAAQCAEVRVDVASCR